MFSQVFSLVLYATEKCIIYASLYGKHMNYAPKIIQSAPSMGLLPQPCIVRTVSFCFVEEKFQNYCAVLFVRLRLLLTCATQRITREV